MYEATRTRRSVRAYRPGRVARPVLEALIDAAIQAPSALNEQPWRFTVIEDQALLDRISAGAKAHMLAAMGETRPDLRAMLGAPDFQIFYHAPALIIIAAPAENAWTTIDCALAAQNLMLAARAEGLGSCWIGFAQAFLDTPDGRALIHLGEGLRAVAPIIVGHPSTSVAPVPRRAPDIDWLSQ